jgi:adenine/guanine phosphoribosyltransferase-like PRPP-binding protein
VLTCAIESWLLYRGLATKSVYFKILDMKWTVVLKAIQNSGWLVGVAVALAVGVSTIVYKKYFDN